MAATYDQGLPTAKDRARFAVADLDVPDNALRQDENYYAVLALAGDERLGIALMAESLAAEFAQRVDSFSESGGISVRWSERVKTWLALAKTIRDAWAVDVGAGEGATVEAVAIRANGTGSEYVRAPSCWGATWFTDP
jgi:hypothetical protein